MKNKILFLFLFIISSCVGTVEERNPDSSIGINAGSSSLSFEGINKIQAISNDKIDVYFYPAQGDPRFITYIVNYDGAIQPTTVPAAVLRPDYRGLLSVTIDGLNIDTEYVFNVQVKDEKGTVSSNDLTLKTKTFSNATAKFVGIGDVLNLSGSDGRNGLIVKWPAAEKKGTVFSVKPGDPVQYEIVLLDANAATPVAFDDPTFVEPIRKVVYVAGDKIEHRVNGLLPGTKYYVRVRSIHQGYVDNGADPSYKKELNNKYLLLETLSDDLASIDVDLSNVTVSVAEGSAGLTSFNLTWDTAKGAIDHYRIYYKKVSEGTPWNTYKLGRDDNCSGIETNDPTYTCKSVNFDITAAGISDLVPYTDYDVHVLVCTTLTCLPAESLEYITSPPYKTEPSFAAFGGVEEILSAKYFWSLDEVFLKFTPPDISSGVTDGLLVEMKARTVGSPAIDTILNHPLIPNSTVYSIANFDYLVDSEIVVRQMDITVSEPYCFAVIPFVWDSGAVVQNRAGEIVKCITPRIETPTEAQYTGITNVTLDGATKTARISWAAPTGGVYNKYILYVRTDGGDFVFGDAIANSNDYVKFEIPYGTLNYSLPFLASGNYKFGVLTYFDGNSSFSDFNTNITTLVVP